MRRLVEWSLARFRMRTPDSADGFVGMASDSTPHAQVNIPAAFHLPTLNGVNMHEITVGKLQASLASGRFTSKELINHCLSRIQSVS